LVFSSGKGSRFKNEREKLERVKIIVGDGEVRFKSNVRVIFMVSYPDVVF